MLKFEDDLKEGKLTVIGALLDFSDDPHQDSGKLNIINVNGTTDPAKLENLESLLPNCYSSEPNVFSSNFAANPNNSTANNLRSTATFVRCAVFAPMGAVMTLTRAHPSMAGR